MARDQRHREARVNFFAQYMYREDRRTLKKSWQLREAAAAGNLAIVEKELAEAIDIDEAGTSGWTALHKASDRGRAMVVRMLLENGSNPDLKTASAADTALHLAAANGYTEVCTELVKVGADVNVENAIGWTPLHAAMRGDKLEVARVLIRAGAGLTAANSSGVSPAMMAVRTDPKKIEVLREAAKLAKAAESPYQQASVDYKVLRDRRLESAAKNNDTWLKESHQRRAEKMQRKADQDAARQERETQLRFSLDVSLRKYQDEILDSGIDYHKLTPADVPELASQVHTHNLDCWSFRIDR